MKSVVGQMHIQGKNMQRGLCVFPKDIYILGKKERVDSS